MFVLDATGSMGDTDSNCTGVPGIRKSVAVPVRAVFDPERVLKVMPTSLDKVGLMIFPGMGTQYSPTSHPCATQPNSVKWYDHQHQVPDPEPHLDNTYNNGGGSLVTTSPMVQAIGNYEDASGTLAPCVTEQGRAGQLRRRGHRQGAGGAAGVVDGHAERHHLPERRRLQCRASNSFATGYSAKATNQCKQAVDAAQAATTAGTKVYSVAYGASTSTSGSSSCSTEADTRRSTLPARPCRGSPPTRARSTRRARPAASPARPIP